MGLGREAHVALLLGGIGDRRELLGRWISGGTERYAVG